MAENPLFYKNVVPLDREAHRNLRLETGANRFDFASDAYLIPAVVDEFGVAARHLPIVFLPGPKHPNAMFLLGLKPGENLFVTAEGHWSGDYIPAFVRRYPFIIGEQAGADPIVCIDKDYDGLRAPSGVPLFSETGEDTPTLRENIQFINDYLAAARKTEGFVARLATLDLFRAITINVRGENARTLHGLQVIDGEKLDTLSDGDFLALRKENAIPLIYAHLQSLASIDKLLPVKSNLQDTDARDRRAAERAA